MRSLLSLTMGACIGFGIGAVLCWLMVGLIRSGRFRPNWWLGINSDAVKHSEETWTLAHLAAEPWVRMAAVAATAASLLTGVSLALGAEAQPGLWFGLAGLVVGGIGVVTGAGRAFIVGNRAAVQLLRERRAKRRPRGSRAPRRA
ncbi:MAG: hypothetical protein ABW091_04120 [Microbacterium sp.]